MVYVVVNQLPGPSWQGEPSGETHIILKNFVYYYQITKFFKIIATMHCFDHLAKARGD